MKSTLIEVTQGILSDMDADEVNAIGDTIESMQIARVVRKVYNGIVSEFDLQDTEQAFQLVASNDTARPTHMSPPVGIFDITWIRYDCRRLFDDNPAWKEIPYASREDFLRLTGMRNMDDPNIQFVSDPSGLPILVHKDGPPTMWTSFDGGRTVVFDAVIEGSGDSTMQTSKTQCLGRKRRTIELDSDAEIDLPEALYPLLINEATELAFEMYKDGAPRKIQELTRRSRVKAKERNTTLATPPNTLPDYGRKRRF
jgi:hypothetical protein